MRKLMLISLLFTFSHAVTPVYACSGGRPPLLTELVEPAEVVIKAEIVETDAAHQNGLLRVQSYIVGGPGPEHLLLQQLDVPTLRYFFEQRFGSGGCATTGPRLESDDTRYFFLIRNPDGTYRNSQIPNQFNARFLQYRFTDSEPTATIYEGISQEESGNQEVNESEFVSAIQAIAGSQLTEPVADNAPPLPAALRLETESGRVYIVPVDGRTPYTPPANEPLWRSQWRYAGQFVEGLTGCTADCQTMSADGTTPVIKQSDQIQWGSPGTVTSGAATGESFLLSPTNELIAVWHGSTLAVHLMNNPRVGFNLLTMSPRPTPYNFVALTGDASVHQASWSHDGRILAYSDAHGLWLWDVYTIGYGPKLVLSAQGNGNAAHPRYWSPGGRYLAITEGDILSNYDTIQDRRLPDGIISPNDRTLMAFDTQADGMTELQFCRLAPEQPCHDLYATKLVGKKPIWESDTTYLLPTCTENLGCGILRDSTYRSAFSSSLSGTIFDYEPISGALVSLDTDDQMLWVRTDRSAGSQALTLPDTFDETIIGVEWLPSPYFMPDD